MAVSVFDLFKIGIGPSSSHTVGPMRAALMFVQGLERDGLLDTTATVKCELYGSLGATGKGHGTDRGVMLGLMGDAPDTVDAGTISTRLETVRASKKLPLLGRHEIPFVLKEHIMFLRQALAEVTALFTDYGIGLLWARTPYLPAETIAGYRRTAAQPPPLL